MLREHFVIPIDGKYHTFRSLGSLIEHCSRYFKDVATFTPGLCNVIAARGFYVLYNGREEHMNPEEHRHERVPRHHVPVGEDRLPSPRGVSVVCGEFTPPPPMAPKNNGRTRHHSSKRPCTRSSPQKEERAPSPMLVDTGPSMAYDLRTIGGIEVNVREAHEARPVWDADVIMEMIRHGAHPPLKEIRDVVQRPRYREAECIFIQPSGVETPSIFIPVTVVMTEYRDMAQQYVR